MHETYRCYIYIYIYVFASFKDMIWPPKFKHTVTLKIAYLHGFELFDSFN